MHSVELPLEGGGVWPAAASVCIFSKVCLAPPERQNRKAKAASSKQARLGTIVSQFRKLRFPLIIRAICKDIYYLQYNVHIDISIETESTCYSTTCRLKGMGWSCITFFLL